MSTECNQFIFGFHPLKHREIRAQFDGGAITTEGGGLLLREVEKRIGIVRQLAACFRDYRDPDRIEHTVEELVAQRVYGLALGYEDLNDHEELRKDPLLAVLVEKSDPAEVAGRKKYVEPSGTDLRHGQCQDALQEDRGGPRGGGSAVRGYIPGRASASTSANHLGSRCHRRSTAWEPGRSFLPRVLRSLLLSAAVYLLW